MNQKGKRAAWGVALVVIALGVGWRATQFRAPIARTPIALASLGPQVGEQVPGFSLPDQNGQMRTLESILGPNGAMLLFYRSADW